MFSPRSLLPAALALGVLLPPALAAAPLAVQPYAAPHEAWCEVRKEWAESLLAAHAPGTWAPLAFAPTDAQLRRLGLPDAAVLRAQPYPEPTLVLPDGRTEPVDPVVYAGPGCLGIRPGALLLTLGSSTIGWCTLGHAYGAPGSYQFSTAGHCGNVGDGATLLAGTGNRGGVQGVVLLDVGRFAQSTGDGGFGNDWALIDVDDRWQPLASPTTCFWGGPRGVFTAVGDVLSVRVGVPPDVRVNPDPRLAQTILTYGHGGAAGGPRAGEAMAWRTAHYAYAGPVMGGDAGRPASTLLGDEPGAQREAAGIDTHVLVDATLLHGVGTVFGTRASSISGTLAEGQLVPYPAPLSGAP